jgi:hypothetical protein
MSHSNAFLRPNATYHASGSQTYLCTLPEHWAQLPHACFIRKSGCAHYSPHSDQTSTRSTLSRSTNRMHIAYIDESHIATDDACHNLATSTRRPGIKTRPSLGASSGVTGNLFAASAPFLPFGAQQPPPTNAGMYIMIHDGWNPFQLVSRREANCSLFYFFSKK